MTTDSLGTALHTPINVVEEAFMKLCEALGIASTSQAYLEVPGLLHAAQQKKAAELAAVYLAKAEECAAEAKRLKMPDGSAPHVCANVWRAAVAIADPEALRSSDVNP